MAVRGKGTKWLSEQDGPCGFEEKEPCGCQKKGMKKESCDVMGNG